MSTTIIVLSDITVSHSNYKQVQQLVIILDSEQKTPNHVLVFDKDRLKTFCAGHDCKMKVSGSTDNLEV